MNRDVLGDTQCDLENKNRSISRVIIVSYLSPLMSDGKGKKYYTFCQTNDCHLTNGYALTLFIKWSVA